MPIGHHLMRVVLAIIVWLICGAVQNCPAASIDGAWSFRPGQNEQFADSRCTFLIHSQVPKLPERIFWKLSAGSRTLVQESTPLERIPDVTDTWRFSLFTPPLNAGVALQVDLICWFEHEPTVVSLPLMMRYANPFEAVRETLASRGIALFDPAGRTAAALSKLEVKVTKVTSVEDVAEESLLILGEGIEWSEELIQQVHARQSTRLNVLILLPQSDASWPLNLAAESQQRFALSQLATSTWRPQKLPVELLSRQSVPSGWTIAVSRDNILLKPGNSPQTWGLAEYRTLTRFQVLFVGVPLMAHWDESPVPREFLAHLILTLTENSTAVKTAYLD